MIRIFNGVEPKPTAVKLEELSPRRLRRVLNRSDVSTDDVFSYDRAYDVLMLCALYKFKSSFDHRYRRSLEGIKMDYAISLKYNFGKDNPGWQIVIDIQNMSVDYQSILAEYFTWDSMSIEKEKSLYEYLYY